MNYPTSDPHLIPSANLKSQRHSSQVESHLLPNPPKRDLLPYPPMRRSLSCPFPQPLQPEIVYRNVSDSDSDDAGCDSVSAGLCEVVPPELQSSAVHGDRESASCSQLESPGEEASREDIISFKTCASSYKLQPSVTSESSILSSDEMFSDEMFSDIASPFAAHSDPFQFTVRLPHSVESPWCTPVSSTSIITTKSPPWNEIRHNSQTTHSSTDYIYRQKVQNRRRLSPQKSTEVVQREDDETPQHPMVSKL